MHKTFTLRNFMRFSIACLIAVFVAEKANAIDIQSFRIYKMKKSCVDQSKSNFDTRKCIEDSSNVIQEAMKESIACSATTCLIKIPCDGSVCKGRGYSVIYKAQSYGSDIHVRLPTGKKAEYSQCGTCNGVEPIDEKQIPLEIMSTAGGIVLEIPKGELRL